MVNIGLIFPILEVFPRFLVGLCRNATICFAAPLHYGRRGCVEMLFYHTPSPLRGTPSILEGEFKTSNIQALPTKIGEVTTKQTEEYDWHFDTASLFMEDSCHLQVTRK